MKKQIKEIIKNLSPEDIELLLSEISKSAINNFKSTTKNEYEEIFNSINDCVFIHNPETGEILDVNSKTCEVFGYSKDELLNLTVQQLSAGFSPFSQKEALEKIELAKMGIDQLFDWQSRKKNGEVFFSEVNMHYINTASPKIIVTIRDITERKLAEEATIVSKERWESLFDNSPNSIAIYKAVEAGMDFEFTDYNSKAQKMTYLNRNEVIGKRITELFPRVEENDLLPVIRRVWQTGKTEYIKSHYVKEKLVEGWLENTFYKLNTGEVVVIYKDITDQVNAENALHASEEKFRSLFENHAAVKFLIDPETSNIIDANYTAASFYGWTLEELKQMNVSHLNLLSSVEIKAEMEKVKQEGRVYFEFKHRCKDGAIKDVEVYSSQVKVGEKFYLHSIVHDITEKKKAELELHKYREHLEELVETRTEELDQLNSDLIAQLQKEKELEMMLKLSLAKEKELNELKTRFISTASHEFRTPLTTVLTSSGLIERYSKKGAQEKVDEHLQKIKRSVDNVINLLDEVLTIGRIESGKTEFKPEAVNLNKFCLEIISEVKPLVNKGNKLLFNFLPKRATFDLDVRLLKSILINLLINAIKYSKEKGKIELKVWTEENNLFIEVADEGIGIPEDEKIHLCEPFYRCNNSGEIRGTGLGLSIVKQSVELHRGELFISSKLGEGSTFKIRLHV